MEQQSEYTMTIHTNNDTVGHFAIETSSPEKQNIQGFSADINHEIASLTTLDVPGGVRNDTRVICTELVRQGRMAPSLQRLDIAFTLKKLSPTTVRGYHFWAIPYVRLMKKSHLATVLIDPFATWRALEIAYQMGDRDKPHLRGQLVRLIAEPVCWAIGRILENLPPDDVPAVSNSQHGAKMSCII